MSDLRDLYQEVILDHSSRPRNYVKLPEPCHHADGVNPLCGDQVSVYLKLEGGVIKDISFQGNGCAISKASASLMTESVKGKTQDQAQEMFTHFHKMVTGQEDPDLENLDKLSVFSGVKEYPARVKCASLAWHTLKIALESSEGKIEKVSTE